MTWGVLTVSGGCCGCLSPFIGLADARTPGITFIAVSAMFVLVALAYAGAYELEARRHVGLVVAGALAALLPGLLVLALSVFTFFAAVFDLSAGARLTEADFVPVSAAFVASACGLVGGAKTLAALADPAVQATFRRPSW
jgi:hypothetical protein